MPSVFFKNESHFINEILLKWPTDLWKQPWGERRWTITWFTYLVQWDCIHQSFFNGHRPFETGDSWIHSPEVGIVESDFSPALLTGLKLLCKISLFEMHTPRLCVYRFGGSKSGVGLGESVSSKLTDCPRNYLTKMTCAPGWEMLI